MANKDIKEHISIEERNKWNKNIVDLNNHLGAGGVANHRLGDGTIPGFSTNDYTNEEKDKLTSVQYGALNNPHPATHPYTMITGLHQVSWTGNYWHLNNIPETFIAGGGDSDTVNGIRVSIQTVAPENPKNDKELWVRLSDYVPFIYTNDNWIPLRAAYQ